MIFFLLIIIFMFLFFILYFNNYFYEYFEQNNVNIDEYKYLMLNNNEKKLYNIELGNSIDVFSEDCYDKCNKKSCIELDERKKNLNNCLKCNMQKNKCYNKSITGGVCNDCDIKNIDDKMNCFDINNFGCPSIKNIENNNGVIPYYIQIPDNNINSPYNKKCIFCWNIKDNL